MTKKLDYKENPDTEFEDVSRLSRDEAEKQIAALREGIDYHDYRYYVENDPVIADSVYDRLFRRLQELEEAFPGLQSDNSPTRRVGAAPVDELTRVEHTAPMLSLNAIFGLEEFDGFDRFVRRMLPDREIRYVLEPKFDGVSVELVYEDGHLRRGATRGDGESGEDITANLRTIGSVPLSLRSGNGGLPGQLSVRGEAFISREHFREMNRERIERGEEPYANARNAAAGILCRLESKEVARYRLDLFVYDLLAGDDTEFVTHREELKQFAAWGLKVDSHVEAASAREEVAKYHDSMENRRDELAYEIDGVVVKLDDKAAWQELGTRHRSPRYAVAWKFAPRKEVTLLDEIVVQVGRTGKLTPVALLQPVEVRGVTVSRASLHNADEVARKDVRPGDKVRIARVGDVIPEIVERVPQPGTKRADPFRMPSQCPVCGTEIVREGAHDVCPAGLRCAPQLIGGLLHYGSRDALDIEGLGEETSRELVERGFVQNLADLYRLRVDDLLQLEGFAEKSARQLHEAIEKTKQPRLDRFLFALGIRHVGKRVARDLAREFRTLDALRRAGANQLLALDEIGPEIAHSVRAFFEAEENRKVLQCMEDLGVDVQPMRPAAESQPLAGKTFGFTGELEEWTRTEAERAVEDRGGRATSGVSGETDYLVAGSNPGGKYEEARGRGVDILDENRFRELLNEAGAPD